MKRTAKRIFTAVLALTLALLLGTAAKLGEEGFIFGLPLRHGRGPPFKGDGGLWPVGGMQICLQFGPLALRCKGGYEGAGQSNKYLQAYAFTRQRPQG